MLRISKHLFGHRNRFYRSANMEISKREKKKLKLFGKLLHSKNYSKTFNDSRNIAIAFWKSNSRLYKNGYYKNGKRQLRNFKCASRIARKIVKKILKKHQKEKNREVKTIHIQSDITKNSIIYFFFKLSFPKYPEMERPSENSSNFFLALFVSNWKEAMSTRNLESWTRC